MKIKIYRDKRPIFFPIDHLIKKEDNGTMQLRMWELHPKACKVERAEKTCLGSANPAGVKWCGPYTNANSSGFWLYPPVDMEFEFDGESFTVHNMEDYGGEDYELVRSLVRPEDGSNIEKWCFPGTGRTKTTVGLVEKNVLQLWTGLIFETPPGWCLHIRNPINFPPREFEIMEAVLETDWMQYDIWTNIVCRAGYRVSLSKNQPLAQLVPARREGFKEDWPIDRRRISRDTPEDERAFSYWLDYNRQKFESGGRQALTETLTKDSTTYFRERNRIVGKEMEACPHMREVAKTLEQEREQFREPKHNLAEYFAVFDKDPRPSMEAIAK